MRRRPGTPDPVGPPPAWLASRTPAHKSRASCANLGYAERASAKRLRRDHENSVMHRKAHLAHGSACLPCSWRDVKLEVDLGESTEGRARVVRIISSPIMSGRGSELDDKSCIRPGQSRKSQGRLAELGRTSARPPKSLPSSELGQETQTAVQVRAASAVVRAKLRTTNVPTN